MARKASPTKAAMDLLERAGWTAGVVERRVTSLVKMDLFGFADIVAVCPAEGVLFLQVTTAHNVKARLDKMLAEPRVVTCLKAGAFVEVWGIRPKPARDGSVILARSLFLIMDTIRIVDGSVILGIDAEDSA